MLVREWGRGVALGRGPDWPCSLCCTSPCSALESLTAQDTMQTQVRNKKVEELTHPPLASVIPLCPKSHLLFPFLCFGCDTYIYFFNSWVQQQFLTADARHLDYYFVVVVVSGCLILSSYKTETAAESQGPAEHGPAASPSAALSCRPHQTNLPV